MKQDQREGIVSSTFETSKICTITKKTKGNLFSDPQGILLQGWGGWGIFKIKY